MASLSRKFLAPGLLLSLAGCAANNTQPPASVSVSLPSVPGTEACIAALDNNLPGGVNTLDPQNISVINWNIQKDRSARWVKELSAFHSEPDLLILQEAWEETDAWRKLVPAYYGSFAEGFGPDASPSGVMTVSAAEPLTECEFVAHEPWLGTRKATLITEYALTGSELTLLVVNIHGINFAFGTQDLKDQFAQAGTVILEHDGPVLFSGDFNTWRARRATVLREMLSELGLVALDFDDDQRKRFLGQALDHIYVRGLHPEGATTTSSSTSDHNPMSVRLRLSEQRLELGAAR